MSAIASDLKSTAPWGWLAARRPGVGVLLPPKDRAGQIVRMAAAGLGPKLPRLHGNLAEVYRAKVARLREALSPEGGREPRLELVGHLTAMLRAAAAAVSDSPGRRHANSPLAEANGVDAFLTSELLDAGTRSHRQLSVVVRA